ncbi:kinase-like domain-containing protein [Rhizophagus irregularis DAOM 181602=DAOM 197198]|uniref:Protein kinase domain-containing protein n=1 Tax=Rhizophagus irregularis (strain DAOM 181602 / DAOM 197198 / MUCL 43194) TaxID=747089 RepID=A0A2P4PJ20_RHIID|nr:hypothetical protein GLOIN_2v1880624 [Rhizophagus irregularis DAOM 181602=DAOM 197198]POG65384.1 hypothetical protein GLOIN_2v1880624 [Rhizophagus irregularis DAOM 181602=DAOM 197198]GET61958.1 kinase-like domain-containing protein [Rhizophagus irregularis DAOM 181602=DAOM 197198]|eukprot:XP_025172250.1 hypothetical protein GLOIN_2v1880624 [Rhizophagus irregularis DAOM 181602=DAOM 197198]
MEIKYSNLENIELIVHGGFGSVYKAVWKDGPIVEDKQAWDLNKSECNLTWKDIIEILSRISEGLDSIYDSKYYLHSGNILNEIYSDNIIGSVISDFEVLLGKEFTKAAVIYEFGMIMSELISGEHLLLIGNLDFDEFEFSKDESIKVNEDKSSEFNDDELIRETFSQKSENKWQAQLAELATNPTLMKRSQNMLTSK